MSLAKFHLTLAVALIATACSPKKPPAPPDAGGPMCTTEAKICPDGTGVGRTGPNCEFAPCPTAAAPDAGETAPPAAPDAAAAPTP